MGKISYQNAHDKYMSEFVPIDDHPNYGVNRYGEVFSYKSNMKLRRRPSWASHPIYSVVLDGSTCSVMYLVAKAFIPNPNNLRYVKPIDGDYSNLRSDNLHWTNETNKGYNSKTVENIFDAILSNREKPIDDISRISGMKTVFVARILATINHMEEHGIVPCPSELLSGFKPMIYGGVPFQLYEINIYGIIRKISNGSISLGYAADDLYWSTRLNFDGSSHAILIHKAVAETFIPNPEGKPCVNHRNGNKLDPCVWNLEWMTFQENNRHAIDTGLTNIKGINNHFAKYDDSVIHRICKMIIDGNYTSNDIAKCVGVTRQTVNDIKNGRSRRDISSQYGI